MVLILCQFHIVKTMVLHFGGSINRRSPLALFYPTHKHLKHLGIHLQNCLTVFSYTEAVADPEFPIGGVDLMGGVDSRGGYVSKILYVKIKESGPLGGGGVPRAHPLDLPMRSVPH